MFKSVATSCAVAHQVMVLEGESMLMAVTKSRKMQECHVQKSGISNPRFVRQNIAGLIHTRHSTDHKPCV